MKALITIQRITEYATTCEMDQSEFDRLTSELMGTRQQRGSAEKELNKRIDVKDWQDDELHQLINFERVQS